MNMKNKFFRDIVLVSMANFIWPLGYSMYINFFPIHIRQLGGSNFVVSLIISIPLFAGILCILGGILADYADRKKIMLFGWAVTIPAPVIWMFADRWEWLLAGTVIYSLEAVCMPALTIYVFDHEHPGNKMTAFYVISVSGMAASIIGPALGGWVLNVYGITPLYLLVFVFYTIATLCILPISGQKRGSTRSFRQYLKWKHIFGGYALKKTAIVILFLSLFSLITNISTPYLPLYLKESKQIFIDEIGFAFSILSIGSVLFIWLFGKTAGKLPFHTSIVAGVVVFLLSILTVIYLNNVYFIYSSLLLRGMGAALATFLTGMIAEHLTGENKGFILSVFITIRNIFIGLAAYPGAFLYQIHFDLLFYTEGILIVLWAAASFHCFFRNYWRNPSFKNQS